MKREEGIYHYLKCMPQHCVGNPLRPKGRVIYWASTLQLSQHLLAEDLSAHPYSLMIITDHLPKWLINKVKAKQIIYLYGFVDIKFRVNGLKRKGDIGRQVIDGCTRPRWKYDPFNKFAESVSLPPPSTSLWIPLFFMKVSFFPKVYLLTECKPHLVTPLSYREISSKAPTVRCVSTNIESAHLY